MELAGLFASTPKGSEYEGEFEYGYDFGTIARVEGLFPLDPICWH